MSCAVSKFDQLYVKGAVPVNTVRSADPSPTPKHEASVGTIEIVGFGCTLIPAINTSVHDPSVTVWVTVHVPAVGYV